MARESQPPTERLPTLFIGSSTESLNYAEALQLVLDDEFEVTIWRYGVFRPMKSTLGSLIDHAAITDFAALFLTPDDETVMRERYLKTARDNLIFELGLFLGHLGRDRVFLLHPKEDIGLPNDLSGITALRYNPNRRDKNYENAVNPAATTMKGVAREVGRREGTESVGASMRMGSKIEVLRAFARLQAIATRMTATLEIEEATDGAEIAIVDKSGLRRSVVMGMDGESVVRSMEELGQSLLDE